MDRRSRRVQVLSRYAIAISLLLAPHSIMAQQPLNLGPLPGVGQVPEFLVPGTGLGFVALATIYMGQPAIFYDNVWIQHFGGIGSPGFRFARAHEYAHHFRGHILARLNAPPQAWPVLGYQEELDADCTAVQYLRHVGDSAAIQAGYHIYQAVLPMQDMNGRPGHMARINNMNGC